MKNRLLAFWDKYFFHIFFFFFAVLLLSTLWIFIGKPPIACTELREESKESADVMDREKKCFNAWQLKELKEYNEYLAEKYPLPDPEDNYFLDRLNPNSTIDWVND